MKIAHRIATAAVASLALIGGIGGAAQAKTLHQPTDMVKHGDLSVMIDGLWETPQGPTFSVATCVAEGARQSHTFKLSEFTATTRDGRTVTPSQSPAGWGSYPTTATVKPGSCEFGYLTLKDTLSANVVSLNHGSDSWRSRWTEQVYTMGDHGRSDDLGIDIHVNNLRKVGPHTWTVDVAVENRTPITFDANWIMVGDSAYTKTTSINPESSLPASKALPLSGTMPLNSVRGGTISFTLEGQPTLLVVGGATFTFPKTAGTGTTQDQPTKSGTTQGQQTTSGTDMGTGLPSTGN